MKPEGLCRMVTSPSLRNDLWTFRYSPDVLDSSSRVFLWKSSSRKVLSSHLFQPPSSNISNPILKGVAAGEGTWDFLTCVSTLKKYQ